MQPPPTAAPWDHKEYYLFSDESVQKGRKYSNFFGGAIVPAVEFDFVTEYLQKKKEETGYRSEIHWQNVGDYFLSAYKEVATAFFDLVRSGHVRPRIFFQKTNPKDHRSRKGLAYWRLYYQFVKHAFALPHVPFQKDGTRLRFFFDQFPDRSDVAQEFREFIHGIAQFKDTRSANLIIEPRYVIEVDSAEWIVLQCIDMVLGSMNFAFNEEHLKMRVDSGTLGKRTAAKYQLYMHILKEIRTIHPHFVPFESTFVPNCPKGNWDVSYRHWRFTPNPVKR